jgi:exportin-1
MHQFKEHPQSWTRVDTILEYSQNPQTKYFALQILEDLIKSRWRILPKEQRDGIKNYIVNLVIKLSTSDDVRLKNVLLLGQSNKVLVQVRVIQSNLEKIGLVTFLAGLWILFAALFKCG